jgi:hypothetical protein
MGRTRHAASSGDQRTALSLVINGVMSRYRDVTVILSHGGGFVPYAVHRFTALLSKDADSALARDDILNNFKRFYLIPGWLPALHRCRR